MTRGVTFTPAGRILSSKDVLEAEPVLKALDGWPWMD
jgi:hypothetical protein